MSDLTIPAPLPNPWSKDALFAKAQQYAEQMLTFSRDDWRFVLWSTFTLELLARAALANISPTLLADAKIDWNNILFALGIDPKAKKFSARSVDVGTVLNRLRELLPDFDPELEGFSLGHMVKRNEELHSGSSSLESIRTSSWLPTFYRACSVLLASLGESLQSFFGREEASVAEQMIAAATDASAREVARTINAHKLVWSGKDDAERTALELQATAWALRQLGHRVSCPSCGCDALLSGTPIAAPIKTIDGDEITETQQYLPSKFECIACELKISGLPQLNACDLGDPYKATFIYDAAEYYRPDDDYSGYEPDFNEP